MLPLLVAALAVLAGMEPQSPPTRADLARAYVRFERAYAAQHAQLPAERRTSLHKAFDSASIAFFTGQGSEVLRQLEALSLELGAAPVPPTTTDTHDYDELRVAALLRLQRITPDGPPLEQALASAKARASLLVNRPSPQDSAQFFCDRARLARELIREIEALEAGEDPYRRRVGDWWRVVRIGQQDLPVRVYAPAAASKDQALPLVVALHGAGGDENMFAEAYGGGMIRALADRLSCLVAAPRVSLRFDAAQAEQLVEALRYHYAIDSKRIVLLGHSMGAGVAFQIASRSPQRYSAVLCLAGGPRGTPSALPATRVIVGALDPLANPQALARTCEGLRKASLPVEFELIEGAGHTLLVTEVLPRALEWAVAQQRP